MDKTDTAEGTEIETGGDDEEKNTDTEKSEVEKEVVAEKVAAVAVTKGMLFHLCFIIIHFFFLSLTLSH